MSKIIYHSPEDKVIKPNAVQLRRGHLKWKKSLVYFIDIGYYKSSGVWLGLDRPADAVIKIDKWGRKIVLEGNKLADHNKQSEDNQKAGAKEAAEFVPDHILFKKLIMTIIENKSDEELLKAYNKYKKI